MLGEVAIRGRDDADIDGRARGIGSHGLDLAVLEEAQEQRLHAQAHLADFVEEQRAAVRQTELADLVAIRAGEAALDVAEQLRFEQRFGDARAVDGHELGRAAARMIVNVPGDDILAGAAFAGHQHFRVAGRGALGERRAIRASRRSQRSGWRRCGPILGIRQAWAWDGG